MNTFERVMHAPSNDAFKGAHFILLCQYWVLFSPFGGASIFCKFWLLDCLVNLCWNRSGRCTLVSTKAKTTQAVTSVPSNSSEYDRKIGSSFSFPSPRMDILKEFLETSTIHGLAYISTAKVIFMLQFLWTHSTLIFVLFGILGGNLLTVLFLASRSIL